MSNSSPNLSSEIDTFFVSLALDASSKFGLSAVVERPVAEFEVLLFEEFISASFFPGVLTVDLLLDNLFALLSEDGSVFSGVPFFSGVFCSLVDSLKKSSIP